MCTKFVTPSAECMIPRHPVKAFYEGWGGGSELHRDHNDDSARRRRGERGEIKHIGRRKDDRVEAKVVDVRRLSRKRYVSSRGAGGRQRRRRACSSARPRDSEPYIGAWQPPAASPMRYYSANIRSPSTHHGPPLCGARSRCSVRRRGHPHRPHAA